MAKIKGKLSLIWTLNIGEKLVDKAGKHFEKAVEHNNELSAEKWADTMKFVTERSRRGEAIVAKKRNPTDKLQVGLRLKVN